MNFILASPLRYNTSVRLAANGSLIIGRKKLQDNKFEDEVIKPDGFVLLKPLEW